MLSDILKNVAIAGSAGVNNTALTDAKEMSNSNVGYDNLFVMQSDRTRKAGGLTIVSSPKGCHC